MTAQDYIIATLHELAQPIVREELGDKSLEEAIYAKVMHKKFRKLKADDQAVAVTKTAIAHAVKENKPIQANLIFGGNKLWHFAEAPEIDWAELFNTMYLAKWLKGIASVYTPGAHLDYYSEDVVLENMNNLPRAETDRYSETFKTMLAWLRSYLPENVTIGYKRYGDEYTDISAYLTELEAAKAKVLQELGGELPTLTEHQKAAVEMNVRLRPGQADDPLWREKVELIHKSIERTTTMENYINDPTLIPLGTLPFSGCITVGSTKASLAKFWVAVGALRPTGDSYTEIVLTPKQLESAEFTWEDINLAGLEGKNFKKIRITVS